MPALLRVCGYRFFFFSMEGREPPQIHVAHDGRVVSVPLVWFPKLADASPRERSDWELIEGGIPDLPW